MQACDFLEWFWESGAPRADAADFLSGSQHLLLTRKRFAGAWRLLTAWQRAEIPARAPPMPVEVIIALAGVACERKRWDFVAALLVGFHGLLRTTEMLTIRRADLVVVMENGRVVETGGHESLIRTGKVYQRIYEQKEMEESLEGA